MSDVREYAKEAEPLPRAESYFGHAKGAETFHPIVLVFGPLDRPVIRPGDEHVRMIDRDEVSVRSRLRVATGDRELSTRPLATHRFEGSLVSARLAWLLPLEEHETPMGHRTFAGKRIVVVASRDVGGDDGKA